MPPAPRLAMWGEFFPDAQQDGTYLPLLPTSNARCHYVKAVRRSFGFCEAAIQFHALNSIDHTLSSLDDASCERQLSLQIRLQWS